MRAQRELLTAGRLSSQGGAIAIRAALSRLSAVACDIPYLDLSS